MSFDIPAPRGEYATYERALVSSLWSYTHERFAVAADRLSGAFKFPSPPVFRPEAVHWNLLPKPGATDDEQRTFYASLRAAPQRWLASGKSSQALALGVFGRLREIDRLDILARVKDDQNRPLFPIDLGHRWQMCFEYEVRHLGEPRPTSVDVFLSTTGAQIAIECKLSEADIGTCSQPRQGRCDGNYRVRQSGVERCPLTAKGILYWRYLPLLFSWNASTDLVPCPLRATYQLARNVLASAVRLDGTIGSWTTVLLYDARNPRFAGPGAGAAAFDQTREALLEKDRLRRGTWQSLTAALLADTQLSWLGYELRGKYGF